ncbi:MAG: fimbrial protein [Cupriavidus necator]
MLNLLNPYQSQGSGALYKVLPILRRSGGRGGATAKPWHGILKAAALLLCLALHGQSFAATFSCTPSASALNFTVPTGTYGVPRDTPVGTRITPFTALQKTYPTEWTCDLLQPYVYFGVAYHSTLASAGMTYSEGGINYTVYQTNVAGVGLIIGAASALPGSGWTSPRNAPAAWEVWTVWTNSGTASGVRFGIGFTFAYVKTGPIQGGTVSLAGTIAEAGMAQQYQASNATSVVPVVVTGNATFAELACKTPDVTVNLGTHQNKEFAGPGTYTSSTGFNIALNNCPAGMNSVNYRIDAVTPVLDAANSVVSLDASSTAAGIGVQLLDSSGNVFPLGTTKVLSDYSGSTGGSYVIPLKARYYQTGSTVTAGAANSGMTFTMTYQ